MGLFDPIGATLGAVGVISGAPLVVGGFVAGVVGAATADPLLAGAGIGVETLGARDVIDGANLFSDSITGDHTPSIATQIGTALNGKEGANLAGRIDFMLNFSELTHAGYKFTQGENLINSSIDAAGPIYSMTHNENGDSQSCH